MYDCSHDEQQLAILFFVNYNKYLLHLPVFEFHQISNWNLSSSSTIIKYVNMFLLIIIFTRGEHHSLQQVRTLYYKQAALPSRHVKA